jgi:hypothetical protein
MPHDQNTSGFFITIIRKTKDFDSKAVQEDPFGGHQQPHVAKKLEEEKQPLPSTTTAPVAKLPLEIQKKSRVCSFEFTRCDTKDPDIEYIQAYYGLRADFPVDQLITQSDDMNKLFFISSEVSRFLYADCHSHNLNIINMGVALFHRNSSKYSSNTECIFRLSQDGLLNLIPYMSKRLVYASDLESFKYFLMNKNVDVEAISDEPLRTSIDNLTPGCFVLALRLPKSPHKCLSGDQEPLVEGIVMHKFTKAVNMMVSRENIFGLHLRYLSQQERESVAALFDLLDGPTNTTNAASSGKQ